MYAPRSARRLAAEKLNLEDPMLMAAELVDIYGPVIQPWLDRAEREYEASQQPKESALDRVNLKLEADGRLPPDRSAPAADFEPIRRH